MSNCKLEIAAFFVGVTIVLSLFWVGGFDFDKRGIVAVYCYLWSFGGGVMLAIIAHALKRQHRWESKDE